MECIAGRFELGIQRVAAPVPRRERHDDVFPPDGGFAVNPAGEFSGGFPDIAAVPRVPLRRFLGLEQRPVVRKRQSRDEQEADGHGDNPDQDGGQLEGRLAGFSGPVRNHVRFAVHFHILGGPGCVSGRSWVPLKPGPLPPLPPPVK